MTEDFERYMEILGIRNKDPELSELGRIVHAHMVRIPFENISKLYYLRNKRERKVTRWQLKNTDELIAAIENTFGIPSAISRVALEGMSMSRSAWS